MLKNKKKIVSFAIAVASILWRPFWGGSFFYCWRWVKYLVLFVIVLCMYWSKGLLNCQGMFDSWQWCIDNWRILGVCISFAIHWAWSHGAWYNYWDNTPFAEDRKPLLVKFVMWLCGSPEKSRTFWGNWLGMTTRYTITAILVAISIPSWWFLLAGVLVGVSYAIPAWFNKKGYYTKWGEVLAGLSNFALLYFCL